MTISIWRYSHLILAISSSLFLLIASFTGIILALEPISDAVQVPVSKNNDEISLATTIGKLQNVYAEIFSLEVDANDRVLVSVLTKTGENQKMYVDPYTAAKIGAPIKKAAIFKFATILHRSLFLKSIGRFFVGLISLLLLIIAITGAVLVLKRQGNIRNFFDKLEKEHLTQYYHVVIGRWLLIPICIIALSGVYLSLEKFSVIPKTKIAHDMNWDTKEVLIKKTPNDFEIFNKIKLTTVKEVEFPFSDSAEDYFLVKFLGKEMIVNQFDGTVMSEVYYPFTALLSYWTLVLHTGKGMAFWAFILLLTSIAILFFMYSGFGMTFQRRKNSFRNDFNTSKDTSEFIILVGSETGSTFLFAKHFAQALSKLGKSVFIAELNDYSWYKKAKHLIVFTSTYGQGSPPSNAQKFEKALQIIDPINSLQYAIVGFGSKAYPQFCKYALDLDRAFTAHSKFTSVLETCKIHNQSFDAFRQWAVAWGSILNLSLDLPVIPFEKKKTKKEVFSVIERTTVNEDDTFLLRLQPPEKLDFQSGDLWSFTPEIDDVERLYSIGKIDHTILLSIKKHEFGVCSNLFSKLQANDIIEAIIQKNKSFYYPNSAKEVIMIANGTGIAPFLGMIHNPKNKGNKHLFWGVRNETSKNIYQAFISEQKLTSFHIAYSQEQDEKVYVQDVLRKKDNLIVDVLQKKGVLMICGSIAMQKAVLSVVEDILKAKTNWTLESLIEKKQIKIDCY